jgi:hypothetical protein
MGSIKQNVIDQQDKQTVLIAEPTPLFEVPVIRLVSKSYHINGLTGGAVSIEETHDGSSVNVIVKNARNRAEISLDYQSFRELSHLLYDVNLVRPESRPF